VSDTIKQLKVTIFILPILILVNLTPDCVAELITERDLTYVLPAANAFARKTEPFPHFRGYTTDGGYFMGVVFLSTEVVPNESWGYRDQIETLVGANAMGLITGVRVLSEFESPRYTKGLLEDGSWFLAQFEEKDASDNFILEGDIDAITGATITSSTVTRSIKAGLELVTEQILNIHVDKDNPVKHLFFQHLLWQKDVIFLWVMVGLAFRSFVKKNEALRYLVLGLSFAYLGIFMGGGFSINDILRLLSLHSPVFLNNLYWYSLVVIAIGLTVFAGRFYCGWLCPFGAITEVLHLLVPIECKITGEADRYLKIVKYVNLGILLVIGLLFGDNILAIYLAGIIEPFATLFNLHGDSISWMWLILMLVFSAVISRFYCRYFCPLGAFFALLSWICDLLQLRLISVNLPEDNCTGCKVAQKRCQMNAINYDDQLKKPHIAGHECFMCNSCVAICPVESKKL